MKSVRDPLTGEPAAFLYAAKDNRGIPGRFDYYRGSGGHIFIDAIPDNLADHYAGGYQQIPATTDELATLAQGDAYRLEPVLARVPGGDFLEIGPWIGLVSYSAKVAGYRVSALEINQECVDLMRRAGIDAAQSDDPARMLAQSGKRYDVIGLWHSIEHIPEPWKVIDAAAKALNPGGLLVIAAPNPVSAQARVLGKDWVHLDAPRHLHLLPVEAYEKIGRDNGLVTVDKTTDDQLGRLLDHMGWVHHISRWARYLPRGHGFMARTLSKRLVKRHRTPGAFDGGGFTLMMTRPADG